MATKSSNVNLQDMSVNMLVSFLRGKKVSTKTLEVFKDQNMCGEALLLVDEGELKELAQTIGDRALIRGIVRNAVHESSVMSPEINWQKSHCTGSEPVVITPDQSSSLSDETVSDTDVGYSSTSTMSNVTDYGSESVAMVNVNETIFEPSAALSNDQPHTMSINHPWSLEIGQPKKSPEPSLPRPFPLPKKFPNFISEALSKKILVGKSRTKFVTVIAQSIHRFKHEPTEEEYRQVVQEMLKQWPFLDKEGSVGALITALRTRMCYLNKSSAYKRRSTPKITKVAKVKSIVKPKYSIQSLVPHPIGEDNLSQDWHTKKLHEELKKRQPAQEVISRLMVCTFSTRRNEILKGGRTFQRILQKYPPMSNPEEIVNEFDRVIGEHASEKLDSLWISLVAKIRRVAEGHDTSNVRLIRDTYNEVEATDDYNSLVALCLLIVMVPDVRFRIDYHRVVFLVEDNEDINIDYLARNMPTIQPCVIAVIKSGSVQERYLVIEKKVIGNIKGHFSTIVYLLAAFYAFNVSYPNGATSFYLLIEALLFKKEITGRKPRVQTIYVELTS